MPKTKMNALTDTPENTANKLVKVLSSPAFSELTISLSELGEQEAQVRINASQLPDFMRLLQGQSDISLNMLLNVTAVDFLDNSFLARPTDDRFDVVYHLLDTAQHLRLRVKAAVSEAKPEIASLTPYYQSANFMEREVFDMYGIKFTGHPDLRRILMYEEFEGHPLRRDYPVNGKQPRIALRHPEVENTAKQMSREELVQIGRK